MSTPSNHKAIIGKCGRCGGQVLRDYYGNECIQCGAEHDKNGQLLQNKRGALIASPRTPIARVLIEV